MLKPIKSLLTYLQKNANSSTILGLTNGMGPIEEPTLHEAPDMMSSEELNCEDPLYDPLALDECDNDVLNVSNVSTATTGTTSSELDTSTAGQIILVDVTSLKSPAAQGVDDDGGGGVRELCSAVELEPVNTSVNELDGSALSLENGDDPNETKSTNLDDDSFKTASCGDTPNVSVNGAEVEPYVNASHTNGVAEVTDGGVAVVETAGQENEEEEASDGSDSGLGSEPSRNLSTLEKETAEHPPVKSNLKRRSAEETTGATAEKRPKKGITFDGVTVYYFTRMQGFGCVPSQGGCTLGMEFQHMHTKRFTLAEHAAEQRKVHRAQLQELNPRSSSSEETDSEEEPSESGSEAESESYGFLQPVTTRQRRALLKAAGVRKIDSSEKDECRLIRTSREVCGCTCRGYCDPDTCSCSQAGIKCQVDRPSFPCGCTQDGCANVVGRVEFNPARVRTHFIHTIMRLNLDNKTSSDEHGGMGIHSAGGYGNSKDWSSGPVRLPGLYGMVGVNGADAIDGYHHHHHHLHHNLQQHQYGVSHNYLANHSVSPGVVHQPNDSLDLHYAFRDYYGTTHQQPNEQLAMSNSLMAPYYGNYPTALDQQYHQSHHTGLVLDQRQPDPHSPYHSQMETVPSSAAILDEDTTLNTPINPNFGCDEQSSPAESLPPSTSIRAFVDQQHDSQTSCSSSEPIPQPTEDPLGPASNASPPSGDFIDLNTPLASNSDRLEAINDLLANSRHQLTIAQRSIIAEEDDELSDFRDPPVMPLSSVVDSSEPCTTEDDTQDETHPQPNSGDCSVKDISPLNNAQVNGSDCNGSIIETCENLSEIIKNSIVETVSN